MSAVLSIDSALNSAASPLAKAVREFMDEVIIPSEPILAKGDDSAILKMKLLTVQARAAGLWGLYFPSSLGGKVSSLTEYLQIAEQEGRSEYGPTIFGSRVTLDVHMLHRYGSETVRNRFLRPMVAGELIGCYGMSEPDSIGSVPATIRSSAVLSNGVWTIIGRKWFISRASEAAYVTVVVRTSDETTSAQTLRSPFSMIIVPTDAPGYKIERQLDVLGRSQGQCEISFNNVEVPDDYVLGQRDRGSELMQQRLGLGRTINSIHWLGLAQRCFDSMCERIASERGELARLSEKQLVRARVFEVYQAIVSTRAQLFQAAQRLDANEVSDIEVNLAKISASRTLSMSVDSAAQIFGAEGLSDLTPLSSIYRTARTTHILDGTDDVLLSTVGRRILDGYIRNKKEHDK